MAMKHNPMTAPKASRSKSIARHSWLPSVSVAMTVLVASACIIITPATDSSDRTDNDEGNFAPGASVGAGGNGASSSAAARGGETNAPSTMRFEARGGASNQSDTDSATRGGASNRFDSATRAGATGIAQSGSSGTFSASAVGGAPADSSAVAKGGSSAASIPAPTCNASTDLIAEAAQSDAKNRIGGDPKMSYDNPCGVQGTIYVFGDTGLDRVRFTGDDTVQSPGQDTTASTPDAYVSPCAGGRCCVKGTTSRWPRDASGTTDYTADVWGGGIAVSLNDPADGRAKAGYAGPATGFAITLSGDLNGQFIRIAYTQSGEATRTPPYKEVTKLGTHQVLFNSLICRENCGTLTAHPYDLWIQIVGGEPVGDFELCVDSVTPLGV
jgi:hypothetical protein